MIAGNGLRQPLFYSPADAHTAGCLPITTGDEKWCLYVIIKPHRSWIDASSASEAQVKLVLQPREVVLCIWLDCKAPFALSRHNQYKHQCWSVLSAAKKVSQRTHAKACMPWICPMPALKCSWPKCNGNRAEIIVHRLGSPAPPTAQLKSSTNWLLSFSITLQCHARTDARWPRSSKPVAHYFIWLKNRDVLRWRHKWSARKRKKVMNRNNSYLVAWIAKRFLEI